ncbi:hypothetical protein EYF80_053679 [Liparis tanakae]|uniref:Uncharacterized protein n=1 Tax=Liparis tanakae TaxID=230148 RepID=A0A4Z2F715_9TELE|nr:hypothetical protein EYF80_053679 [Liparis tanakae]
MSLLRKGPSMHLFVELDVSHMAASSFLGEPVSSFRADMDGRVPSRAFHLGDEKPDRRTNAATLLKRRIESSPDGIAPLRPRRRCLPEHVRTRWPIRTTACTAARRGVTL